MNVEKTAYWLALAAFGFALLDVCPRGVLQDLSHALGHTGSTLCRLAANAERSVAASAVIARPRLRANSLSATDARELAQLETQHVQEQVEQARSQYRSQYEDQIDQAQDQAEQTRDQALARADAVREEALANAESVREEALAKADAIRGQALAQAAIARAEVEMKSAGIEQLRVHVRPQIRLSHAANHRFLDISIDPCDYSRVSDAVRASMELSDDEQ
jgi:hypothetical protein